MEIILQAQLEDGETISVRFWPDSKGVGMGILGRECVFNFYEFRALVEFMRERNNGKSGD